MGCCFSSWPQANKSRHSHLAHQPYSTFTSRNLSGDAGNRIEGRQQSFPTTPAGIRQLIVTRPNPHWAAAASWQGRVPRALPCNFLKHFPECRSTKRTKLHSPQRAVARGRLSNEPRAERETGATLSMRVARLESELLPEAGQEECVRGLRYGQGKRGRSGNSGRP